MRNLLNYRKNPTGRPLQRITARAGIFFLLFSVRLLEVDEAAFVGMVDPALERSPVWSTVEPKGPWLLSGGVQTAPRPEGQPWLASD